MLHPKQIVTSLSYLAVFTQTYFSHQPTNNSSCSFGSEAMNDGEKAYVYIELNIQLLLLKTTLYPNGSSFSTEKLIIFFWASWIVAYKPHVEQKPIFPRKTMTRP